MIESPDIRWKQRYENYTQALQTVRQAIALSEQRPLSELEQQGLIQGFEFTVELAWKVLKLYLVCQGVCDPKGPRDAIDTAFKNGLIEDVDTWRAMIKARNETSHSFDCDVAQKIANDVMDRFFPVFVALEKRFETLG